MLIWYGATLWLPRQYNDGGEDLACYIFRWSYCLGAGIALKRKLPKHMCDIYNSHIEEVLIISTDFISYPCLNKEEQIFYSVPDIDCTFHPACLKWFINTYSTK